MTEHRSATTSTSMSLLERIRENDAMAWDRLVNLYAPYVLDWCGRYQLGSEDVADVFQEVFQAAARKIGDFKRTEAGDTFRGWLRTITRNKVMDHFRRQDKEPRGVGGTAIQAQLQQVAAPVAPDEDATPDEDAGVEESAQTRLLGRALAQIESSFQANTWRAFRETAITGRSPKDVAEELGMSPGAVRVAKCRVLQRLRAELGDIGP